MKDPFDRFDVGSGREKMHATLFHFENQKAALNERKSSSRFLELNGEWKFAWFPRPGMCTTALASKDVDDTTWNFMAVPGNWELHVCIHIGFANAQKMTFKTSRFEL